MILIVDYQPGWPDAFADIAARVRACLGAPRLVIHHIGSTSVPRLAAKDIIDMQVSVDDLSAWDGAALEAGGFEHVPNKVDHCPPGFDLPPEQLEKRLYKYGARPAHVHVRETGRFNQRYPLLNRDYLRSHPAAAAAYAQVKRALAVRFPEDTTSYYAVKDPVSDLIMAGAEDWARQTGWTQPAGD